MALRRVVPEVISLDLGYLRMWRDDLGRMVKVLEKICDGHITMRADDWEFDSVDDLAALAADRIYRVRSFSLVGGKEDKVKLQLGDTASLLEIVGGDELSAKGAAQDLYRLAVECRRLQFQDLLSVSIGSLIAVTPIIGTFAGAASRNRQAAPHVILETRTRAEAPSFWVAKKNDIWITVVSNVIALALGGVIGYFVNVWTSGRK